MPIDFLVPTPGGLVLAAEQIAFALKRHKGKVTVFVPHYAMSGGALLAISADELVMDLFPQTSQRRPSVEFIPLPYTAPQPAGRPRGEHSSS